MSDYAERIEGIASKLRDLLADSEELKRLVEQRMMHEEDVGSSAYKEEDVEESQEEEEDDENEDDENEDDENEPVVPELITRKPWCWFCCRRY